MKFKVGDRVILGAKVKGIQGDTTGITGTIEAIEDGYSYQQYLVRTDKTYQFLHSGSGRFEDKRGVWINDDEATLLPEGSFIVVKRTYAGQLLPSCKPFQHETRVSAENEAVRLAKQNLGNDFVVFQMVTEVKTPVIPEPTLNRLD